MISPLNKVGIVILIFSIPLLILKLNRLKNQKSTLTVNTISEIKVLLKAEKKQFGYYPRTLKTIIHNNPLRKKITLDAWKNEFIYIISKDSLNYTLISLGKDGKPNTSDDITVTN